MIMHDFEYVTKEEWEPIRDELFEIIHRLQNEVRDDFTFQYHFVGSSKRKMISIFLISRTAILLILSLTIWQ